MMMMLGMPIVLVILFGFAITMEIRSVPIAVLDESKDEATRQVISHLGASEYFDFYGSLKNTDEAEQLFREGKIRMVVVFPARFSESLLREGHSPIQMVVDATDPNEAVTLTNYVEAVISSWQAAAVVQTDSVLPLRIVPEVKLLYNPQMKGAYSFVPGVMGLILILICAMMTSVGIVKEKEMGTMEVLLVSPLCPVYIIIAKAVPYLLLSLANIATILLLSYYLLDVPIVGSVILLFGLSILYSVVALSLGLFISTITDTQQSAMLVSSVALMLPVILLSGMMFPIENMPKILQYVSNVVPAKWFITAVKDVMIKGLGIESILNEVMILAFMAAGLIGISVVRFKKRLE